MLPLLPLLLPLLLTTPQPAAAAQPKNAIRLSQVQSLTLRGSNAQTTHRRVSAIPQLKCISSPAVCSLHSIDIMRCENAGSAYGEEDVEWTCKATLPEELKLGSTDVICEGYAHAEDPYVLKGSCGVEYRLVLTTKGEVRYPKLADGATGGGGGGDNDWSGWLFIIFFAAMVIWIVWAAWGGPPREAAYPRQRRNRGGSGGGGGGGDGGGGGGGGDGGGWGPRGDPPPYPGTDPKPEPSSQSGSWRPGFWSGTAAGATGGYAAGRYDERRRQSRRDNAYGNGEGSSSSTPLFVNTRPSPPSGASGETSESTGFGSSRRR